MKATLKIDDREIEMELTPEQQQLIKRSTIKFTDIKTLEDALAYLGESVESFNQRTSLDDDTQKAHKELEVICMAIRLGNDLGENWYYPWFNSTRSASGFSFHDYNCDDSASHVGSRLCVETAEKAKYIGEQFTGTYNRYINGSVLRVKSDVETPSISPKVFKSYTDIKTFTDACLSLGIDATKFEQDHAALPEDVQAYMQLRIISQALNGGTHMDYSNVKEYKYFPYFNAAGSASGFSYLGFDCDHSLSLVGSRLAYKSSDIAEYAGKQFIDIYNKYTN